MPQTFGQLSIDTDLLALASESGDRNLLREMAGALKISVVGRVRDARGFLGARALSVVLLPGGERSDAAAIEALVADIAKRAPGMIVVVLAPRSDAVGDLNALAQYAVSDFVVEQGVPAIRARVVSLVESARFRARLRQVADRIAEAFSGSGAAIVRDAVRRGDEVRSVEAIAAAVGLSVRDLERVAKREIGLTPTILLGWGRLFAAMVVLEGTLLTCERVANDLEFASASAFSSQMRRYVGAPPDVVRRGGGTQLLTGRFLDAVARGRGAGC